NVHLQILSRVAAVGAGEDCRWILAGKTRRMSMGMADAPKPAKIATFGVRFESYDDFLVEYTDNLRRGFLMLPGVRNLEASQPVRVKLSLPNRAILYLSGTAFELGADGGKGTLIKLAAFTAEQER